MTTARRRGAAGERAAGPSQLKRNEVLLQITTADNDYFRAISLGDLLRIAGSDETTLQRNASVWELSRPHAVETTGVIDYFLVLDGHEDDESWKELSDDLL